jgi:hypothetical protein
MSKSTLITEGKAITNHRESRNRLMKSGGSYEDWNKLLDAQVASQIHNWPKETASPRWAALIPGHHKFLITADKAWENMNRKRE